MKHLVLALALGFAAAGASAAPALAKGTIETACLRSDRPAANRTLCGCLQKVADAVLSPSHQTRGAGFFDDPDKSHAAKISQSASDKLFWVRWEGFASTAVKHCQ